MNDKQFLEAIKNYIEEMEERCQQEWGEYLNLPEMIERGLMPEIYTEVLRRISDIDIYMSEFKPIKTAPKDGSEIIVCEAGTNNIEFVRWINGELLDRTSDPFSNATHWMNKPKIPIQEK